MSARRGFVCAGCWTADRIKHIDAWPAEETLAMILGIDCHGGGSAHNFGHDIRRLDPGMPVEAIGLLGQDPDGDFLFNAALAAGMDVAGLRRHDTLQTSFTDVMTVRGVGRRTFFHHTGTNDALSPVEFNFSTSRARVLHLGLLGLHATLDSSWDDEANGWVAVLKAARSRGLKTNIELVSIDPVRQREIALPCLPYLDTLIVNDHEIGSLAGIETIIAARTDAAACERAARDVLALGSMEIVVVHWPAGAVAVTSDGLAVQCAARMVASSDVRGTVGAGDAFAAGVQLVLHDEGSIEDALALGHAAAAASLLAPDAVSAVPHRASID